MTSKKPNSPEQSRSDSAVNPHELHAAHTDAEKAAAQAAIDRAMIDEASPTPDGNGGTSHLPEDTATLKAQLAEAETKALRYQADLDNFRRRARREADEQLKYANLGLIAGIVEAIDNLQRAVAAAKEADTSGKPLVQGVEMVIGQIQATLRSHGCEPIAAEGQPFDPNLHQAIQSRPCDDCPPNTVLQELRIGYRLHDRVVRPSQVVVSASAAKP